LREERRLRKFDNTVLRRTFGPESDEVTGEWRRLHNEELQSFTICTLHQILLFWVVNACWLIVV
jgi:hypothetical protein